MQSLKYRSLLLSIFNILIFIFFSCSQAFSLSSEVSEVSWHISAMKVSYDKEKQLYIAEDNVLVKGGETRLQADYVEFSNITRDAVASGNVMLMSGNDVVTCDSLDLNLEEETGTIYNGTVFIEKNNFFIKGNTITKSGKETYHADRASLTSCAGEKPDWKISARNIRVTIEGYGVAKGATLWAGNIPALYSPIVAFPAKKRRQTGLLTPRFFSSDRKGFEIEQPLFIALSRQTDATLYADYMKKRGTKAGLEFRYVLGPESRGTLLFDHLNDLKIDDETAAASEQIINTTPPRTNRNRYWFRMKSDHRFDNTWRATMDLDYVSDADYLHEFRDGNTGYTKNADTFKGTFGRGIDEYDDDTRKNSLNLNKTWSYTSLNIGMQWFDNVLARQQDSEDTTLQRLPTIKLDTIRQKIGHLPLYFDMDSEYSFFHRKDTSQEIGTDGTQHALINGHRSDIFPKLHMPFQTGAFFIEPSVGFRQTVWYADADTNSVTTSPGDTTGLEGNSSSVNSSQEFSHREMLDLNVAVSTKFSRVFNTNNDFAEKIKHEIIPKIEYGFIPDVDQDDLPKFDSLDSIEKKNGITWTLTSRLTSRNTPKVNPKKKSSVAASPFYREFAWIELSQSYDLDPDNQQTETGDVPDNQETWTGDEDYFQGSRHFSDISAEIEFSPGTFLSLKSDFKWSPHKNRFNTYNTGLKLRSLRGDSIYTRYGSSYNYNYDKNSLKFIDTRSESIYTRLAAKLTSNVKAFAEYEQDLETKKTILSKTGFYFKRPCWSMSVSFRDTPNDRAFSFMVNLNGIGGFGTE